MLVVDIDCIIVWYDNVFKLMYDLCGMVEINILVDCSCMLVIWSLMFCVVEIYVECFVDLDGCICVSFEIVYFGGWVLYFD